MDLGSGIRKKLIRDPGSRCQKGTGSRIRIRNTVQFTLEHFNSFVNIISVRYGTNKYGTKTVI
jgi:hypothetical protein